MDIRQKWFTAIMIILALMTMPLGDVSHADDRARDRSSLKGIQAVVVIVHAVAPEWQNELAKV
ncbi:MAG: hypothetical protein PVF98_02450, partial [Desulfobacterales bacterium]